MSQAEQDAFWRFHLKPIALRVRAMTAMGVFERKKDMTTTLRVHHIGGAHPISVSGATNVKIMPGESADVTCWQGNGLSIVELSAETAPAKRFDGPMTKDTSSYPPKVDIYDQPIKMYDVATAHSVYLDPTPSVSDGGSVNVDTGGTGSGSFDTGL